MLSRLEAKLPPLLVVALVGAAMWGIARVTVSFEPAFWLRLGLAGLLVVTGVVLVVAGLLEFRRASTTVNPMAPEESSSIVQSGIYRHTRNPMYLGFLLALIAWAVWLAAPWALLGPVIYVVGMTRFQIIPEERALAEQFGEDYLDYCRRTRRWI